MHPDIIKGTDNLVQRCGIYLFFKKAKENQDWHGCKAPLFNNHWCSTYNLTNGLPLPQTCINVCSIR
ncbi:hypothetical protein QQF64_007285 [Cirrhinus molitorella]|uniref:Uncharacterized protein n=1 Tax=Cirrhinus molitorella TaxID=172907 RepID=A0ABR3MAY0_9TELE